MARGVQLLVHAVAAVDPELATGSERARGLITGHATPEDAARVFRQAHPYLAIYAPIVLLDVSEDQLMRRTHALYPGAVQIGRDLMVIEIQNELQVRNAPSEERRPRD
jgi:ribonuclease Z